MLFATEYTNGVDFKNEWELEAMFLEELNNRYDPVHILGGVYLVGNILKEMDPANFRETYNNWLDSEGWNEVQVEITSGGYYKEGEYFQEIPND